MKVFREPISEKKRHFRVNIVKLIVAIPIFAIIPYIVTHETSLSESVIRSVLVVLNRLGVTGENAESFAKFVLNILNILTMLTTVMLFAFVLSFRNLRKFIRRLFRSFPISLLLAFLGFALIVTSIAFTAFLTPDANILPTFSDLLAGLGTEVTGALLLFILLEVFAKTWEENEETEEAEYAARTAIADKRDEQLQAIIAQWEALQNKYAEQAKSVSQQSILNRLFSSQEMPIAYYEGQAQALSAAMRDLQVMITSPNEQSVTTKDDS